MTTQLAFLLLAVKLSEQLQGTRNLLCGTTQPGSPITYFRARGGTSQTPSDSDQIWILCRAALLSLVAPIGTTRVLRCSLGCQSSNTAGASSVVCQMAPRREAFLPLASVTRLFCAAPITSLLPRAWDYGQC